MRVPANDSQLMAEVHNYDPAAYAMCGDAVKTCKQKSWGTAEDITAVGQWMEQIQKWSATYHLPIYYGEFGCTHAQNASTGRNAWYAAHAAGIRQHGFAAAVWDDDGG